jgi:hypothetical protein
MADIIITQTIGGKDVSQVYEDLGDGTHALKVSSAGGDAGGGGGGGEVTGADAVGAPLVANPVAVAGIDWDGNILPLQLDETGSPYVTLGASDVQLFARHRQPGQNNIILSGSGNGLTGTIDLDHAKSAYIFTTISNSTFAGGSGYKVQIRAVASSGVSFVVFEAPLLTANGNYVYLISEVAPGNAKMDFVSGVPLPDKFTLNIVQVTDGTGTADYVLELRTLI